MATCQTTCVAIDDATRIQLFAFLNEAQAAVGSVTMAIEVMANSGRLPMELNKIAKHTREALLDLDARVRDFLDGAEQG